jgi:tetratricopeptide (TPR) repeat protein
MTTALTWHFRGEPTSSLRACRSLATVVFVLVFSISAGFAQQPAAGTIRGTVRDAAGIPVSGASVRLEHAGAPPAETRTNVDGGFTFSAVPPGAYSISAEISGRHSGVISVSAVQSESRNVDLTISASGAATATGAASSSPGSAMEFADNPNFTIAAVTDWTAAGGHGSDAVLRTSEALNREALNLKPDAAGDRPPASTKESKATESTLRADLAKAPAEFETNHRLGEFYLHAGRYAESVQPLKTAYSIDPKNLENEYDFALALKGGGDFAAAREHVGKLTARNDSADVDRLGGEIAEKLGDPLSAVHEFERAARKDPSEQNYFEWGSELLLHRAVWQAKDVFSTGVNAYPTSARMLTALGAALFAGALYDEAAQRLCEASDLNPADPEPYRFMGKIEMSAPDPLPCVEQKLARFATLRPADPLANYYYAMTIWKQKGQLTDPATLDRVKDLLTKAVEIDPQCSDAYLQLGVLQSTRRDYAKAIEFYSKAIETNPQMSEAHYRLGIAYDRVGDKEKAAQQFKLHDEIEKQQAATVEQHRRAVKQFLVVVDRKAAGAAPQ